MIAYHYTSKNNLDSILKKGLKPYPIRKDELLDWFDVYPMAVWLWENNPEPKSELGNILFQISEKGCLQIVKFEVEYNEEDLLFYDKAGFHKRVVLNHEGAVGIWIYHKGDKSVLSVKPIPPEKIKHIATFDALDIIKHKDKYEHNSKKTK